MKTLDQAVQIAILSEAGSTYRNAFLSSLKEHGDKTSEVIAQNAANGFIDLATKWMAK